MAFPEAGSRAPARRACPLSHPQGFRGVADRRQMFRMFDRDARRPNRWEGGWVWH
ncbi:DUF1419 domain-containing protein [Sinorhizobium meliloti]|nr:DUF1419 domain-containing protein [Sinorhizobium meliloti]RVO41704.1 DUF1419 domain-containing protein [Sinorhizobium meliloti]